MTDKEFLIWIYSRLHNVHDEPKNIDYMMRLDEFIKKLPDSTLEDRYPTVIEEAEREFSLELYRERIEKAKEELRRKYNRPWYKKVFPFTIHIERN